MAALYFVLLSFFFVWIYILVSLDANVLFSIIFMAAYLYSTCSVLFNPRWNVFNNPFSPIVMFKGIVFLGICINMLGTEDCFSREIQGVRSDVLIAIIGLFFLMGTDLVGILFRPVNIQTISKEHVSDNYSKIALVIFGVLFIAAWAWRFHALSWIDVWHPSRNPYGIKELQ